MKILFTQTAIDQLTPSAGGSQAQLRLVYDTEGCGCAVNGVPSLWLVSEAPESDIYAEADPFKVSYSVKDEIFFEDVLKIDYQPEKKSYILKSNGQIYNAGMDLVDKR